MFLLLYGGKFNCAPRGQKHGVSLQLSINLGDTYANNARTKNSKDLIRGDVVYISVIYRVPDS